MFSIVLLFTKKDAGLLGENEKLAFFLVEHKLCSPWLVVLMIGSPNDGSTNDGSSRDNAPSWIIAILIPSCAFLGIMPIDRS